MRKSLLAAVFVCLPIAQAGAVDIHELLPCKPAAIRYCDKSGSSMGDLIRCAARLASVSDRIGDQCRGVLKRYGQL